MLEVPEEKILCPEKIVSALWYWRREVLWVEKVSCLFSPVERQRKARPYFCVCDTYFPSMLKMFLSQWVLPCPCCYQHCLTLVFLLWLVQILLSSLSSVLPPLPCWMATAEAIKLQSL